MACICEPRYSLPLNGAKTDWIHAICGLRQGCPLSPYFLYYAPNSSSGSHKLAHNLEYEFIRKRHRRKYCTISGQAVNNGKSNVLFGPKVNRRIKAKILTRLGCKEMNAIDYLGIKLRVGRLQKQDFSPTIAKMGSKINSWGIRHVSIAGRIKLNCVLAALLGHQLASTTTPVSFMRKINSVIKSFLWSGATEWSSIHYIPWEDICTSVEKGGLGIRNLQLWRNVLMAKFAARIFEDDDSVLASIFGSKYGMHKFNGADMFRERWNQSKIWKTICSGGDIVLNETIWMVGNGEKINMLNDNWISDLPLQKWPAPVDTSRLLAKVSDLLLHGEAWDGHMLQMFSPELRAKIYMLRCDFIGEQDLLVWTHSERREMISAQIYYQHSPQTTLQGD